MLLFLWPKRFSADTMSWEALREEHDAEVQQRKDDKYRLIELVDSFGSLTVADWIAERNPQVAPMLDRWGQETVERWISNIRQSLT